MFIGIGRQLGELCSEFVSHVEKDYGLFENEALRSSFFGELSSRFIRGATVSLPLAAACTYAALPLLESIGLLKECDDAEFYDDFAAAHGITLDGTSIVNADCPKDEYVRQFNLNIPDPSQHVTVFTYNCAGAITASIAPVAEEILVRYCFQGFILKKLIAKTVTLDPQTEKKVRVISSAILFSLLHYLNYHIAGVSCHLHRQVACTLFTGVVFSSVFETAGLIAAIGAHTTTNLIVYAPELIKC